MKKWVKIQYIIDIVQSVYNGFNVENIKFSNIKDVIKRITRVDTFPLYKGFDSKQLR